MKENCRVEVVTISKYELIILIENAVEKALERIEYANRKGVDKYVHGLQGIADLFGVSRVTTQKYKNTWLADAVSQQGKVLLTDTDKAIKLFKENQETD